MIVVPQNKAQAEKLLTLLQEGAGVQPSPELMMVGWVIGNQLVMVVGFDTFIGKTCHIHVSMAKGFNFTPKKMLKEVFEFAFNEKKLKMLVGVVNSRNEAALKYDLHLGFEESVRFPEMHDDGGDIVVLVMRREQCRYLNMKEAA